MVVGVAISLEGVSKWYASKDGPSIRAVNGVSLGLGAGSSTALVGPSGSGKSTLLHLMGGLDRPSAGRIVAGGVVVTGLRGRGLAEYRAGVGFVFQQFHLIPVLSLVDNVCAPLVGRRFRGDRRQRARELLAAVGLKDRWSALPSQLSGGQQQRVAIARALIVNPSVLLADEPTGNLDSVSAAEVLALIGELRGLVDPTIVIATHDAEVAASCERTVRIRDGRVVPEVGESAGERV